MKALASALAVTVLLLAGTRSSSAQAPTDAGQVTRTFRLNVAVSQADANEISSAVRNLASPTLRIFLVASQNAIVVRGTPTDVSQVAEVINMLDRPRKQYRLTYTLTETDEGKRVGLQRYSMILNSGQRMQMKEGNRVPVVTGSFSSADKATEKQATYLDVGLNFDSILQEYGTGIQLQSKVEQSSMALEKSGVGPEDPVIRQTFLQGVSILTEGKPLALGTLDVIGSTRHLEIEATVEAVR